MFSLTSFFRQSQQFVLLAIAALTSAVSLLEVVVTYLVDEKNLTRKTAAWLSGSIMFFIGIPASLSLGVWKEYTLFGKGFFDLLDYLSSNLLLPLGGIFIALFARASPVATVTLDAVCSEP